MNARTDSSIDASVDISIHARNIDADAQGETVFQSISNDLCSMGFSVQHHAVPAEVIEGLSAYVKGIPDQKFKSAGIGRDADYMQDWSVRTDEICWITGESEPGRRWLEWVEVLRTAVNRELMLGLFTFESQVAHYPPGACYRRHLDAFSGEGNRILSVVVYLNETWQADHGGELLIYPAAGEEAVTIMPCYGTAVFFLSEQIPHEVLTARRDRYSIAGWFRLNSSHSSRADPPA